MKLRHILFLTLFLSGIIPLIISSSLLIRENRAVLETQQRTLLTTSAQAFASSLSAGLEGRLLELRQLGRAIATPPGAESLGARLVEPWVRQMLVRYAEENPGILAFRAVVGRADRAPGEDPAGLVFAFDTFPAPIQQAGNELLDDVVRSGRQKSRFVVRSRDEDPAVALTIPISMDSTGETLVVQTFHEISFERLTAPGAGTQLEVEEMFVVDEAANLLWSGGAPEIERALLQDPKLRDFDGTSGKTSAINAVHSGEIAGRQVELLWRIVPVPATGWGVVAHRSLDEAFGEVQQMVYNTILSSVLLLGLALALALFVARALSQPIQQLAETSHELATGNFGQRVPLEKLSFELADLGEDFNRMGDYVESYIERLKRAASENRQLFISTIRAFAATIDAKDPYTRGHSERVAAYSRSIARTLGLAEEMQERVWISGLLHDVGKIGVEDRVLKKAGVLTPEEFDQMKLHPVIGAEILEPISALREMLPGVRWHHEAWNGTGYPDKIKGEQIPLMARIIGVADTFDAITTNRPYQNAYSTEYAIETLKKLTGSKFDERIVKAFLEAWDSGQIRLDKEQAEKRAQTVQTLSQAVATSP